MALLGASSVVLLTLWIFDTNLLILRDLLVHSLVLNIRISVSVVHCDHVPLNSIQISQLRAFVLKGDL